MVFLDEENSAAAPAACQSRPAFPSQSDCSSTCGTTEETLKAGLLFLPVTLDLCLGFFFCPLLQFAKMRGRVWTEREEDR